MTKRFVHFQLENYDVNLDLWPWGGEPIYRNGQFAGLTTTCGYGFALDRMVCLDEKYTVLCIYIGLLVESERNKMITTQCGLT